MKLARPATLLTVGLMALSLGGVGCNKNRQNPETLLGHGAPIVDDGRGKPIGDVLPVPISRDPGPGPITGDTQGLKPAPGDWDKWFPNPIEFKDQTVYFDFDKASVRPSEVGKLKEVARRMKSFPGKALRIEGHCDERGTEEYNRALGDRRAQSIREFLHKEGFDANMMPTITYGEDKPADPGHNEAAYAKNRRGELILLSPTP
jgi:peptidoglycan-associated lipoprotein